MRLKEIVSCYVTKSYDCRRPDFEEMLRLFEARGNVFEKDWKRVPKSDNRVIFLKGAPIDLTFDYTATHLEVQVIFEFEEERSRLKLSVGDTGFPFEPLLAKKRYVRLLEGIDRFLLATGRVSESSFPSRHEASEGS